MASVIRFCLKCERMAHQDICPTCESDDDLMSQKELKRSIEKWQRRGGLWGQSMVAKRQVLLNKFLELQGETGADTSEPSPALIR